MSGKPAARVSDTDACPLPGHGPNPVVVGSPNVLINNLPAARVGDATACGDTITVGIPTILINGMPIAHLGSATAHGGVIISGSGNVLVGSSGGGAPMSPVGALQIGGAIAAVAVTASALLADDSGNIQFDEQLRLQAPNGQPYSLLPYTLTLENGSQINGTTDAEGKTQRIQTTSPQTITQIALKPPSDAAPCCAKHTGQQSSTGRVVELQGVKTNPQQLGSSVHSVTLDGESRPLTSGEIAMARSIFKDAIDYTKVKVHRDEYLPFGLQPNNTAMTPNGELYFNPAYFQEDFSSAKQDEYKHWFMHEMVHVWQHQLGYWVKLHGMLLHPGSLWGLLGDPYHYTLDATKKLHDYNMEQQGDIIADHYALSNGLSALSNSGRQVRDRSLYNLVLADFLKDPSNANALP
ncbi:Rhs element Vgr protein [Pseudomonas sp. 8AS]|uniref:PAAR domain-containing protein n=1 Tax=Pseudomonas sp. 8AS TaxID=2653163 RepID=UPI0012F1FD76|nr:PAAR domain-containing protein [Pseudomonas sp. 8AS]VXB18070.1 Rhs element Vgr protein [Pseudomonas sp. 8AS]